LRKETVKAKLRKEKRPDSRKGKKERRKGKITTGRKYEQGKQFKKTGSTREERIYLHLYLCVSVYAYLYL
jgi:hypothetical protein